MNNSIFRKKQMWLDALMASRLTSAQKVFGYSIFKRAYGDKLVSYPATHHVELDTGLSRSKFSSHRQALFDCGALTGSLDRQARGRQANYTYSLNLDWDGQVSNGGLGASAGELRNHPAPEQSPEGSVIKQVTN